MKKVAFVVCLGFAATVTSAVASKVHPSYREIEVAQLHKLGLAEAWMKEGLDYFELGERIWQNVEARKAKHLAELHKRGITEAPLSKASVTHKIVHNANPDEGDFGHLHFDEWGEIYLDRRFLTPQEAAMLQKIEAFIWEHIIKPHHKGDIQKRPHRATAGHGGMPIFRGFEDPHYQQHDKLILTLVEEFNRNKAIFADGTALQAEKIANLTPAMVKAHMIEESGGHGPGSVAAWKVDPLQVNVPGDWTDDKLLLGLQKPVKRNEGSPEQNIRAAIMFLTRKGFGISAHPAKARPTGFFDGWYTAFRRYNGRRDWTEHYRHYSEEYADKIIERANDPNRFVPIEIKLEKKK